MGKSHPNAGSADTTIGGDQGHPQPAIVVRDLKRSYGSYEAVRGVDLRIERGEIFALLGPNGAGKTTTLEILEGFRRRSSGTVTVLGVDPEHGTGAWRNRIGVVLQESLPEAELSVRECVALYAGYYTAPRGIDETLAEVGLAGLAERRCDRLSGGQLRRLDVALALIGNPELLFLDEPTTGFDPEARRAMWGLVAGLSRAGVTIVLTTHYMDEAERLADQIAVMAEGRIVALDTPNSLSSSKDTSAEVSFTLPVGVTVADLPVALGAPLVGFDSKVRVVTDDTVATVHSLTRWALDEGHKLPDLEVRRSSLEDIYLQLTTKAG